MQITLKLLKLIIFIIVSYASILKIVDFITSCSKNNQYKKLFGLTLIIWLLMIGLLNLIGRM